MEHRLEAIENERRKNNTMETEDHDKLKNIMEIFMRKQH